MSTLTGLSASVTFGENSVNAAAALIDNDVTFIASGSLTGATLTVSGLLAEDRVSLRDDGNGAGQVGFDGTTVRYGGVAIGTASGGMGGTFSVTFNANATSAAAESVIEHLTFADASNNPTATRSLVLDVTDTSGTHLTSTGMQSFARLNGTANPFSGITVGNPWTKPTFVDLDGDGRLDLVAGLTDGTLVSFHNTGSGYTQLTGTADPFAGINVGRYATPVFQDLDGDGRLDLIVGEVGGRLFTWHNTGSGYTQLLGAANPFDGFDVGIGACATFVDLNGDGVADMVSGARDGTIHAWLATGTGYSELLGTANPFNGIDVGIASIPVFYDIDGDGRLDLISGDRDGTVLTFRNTGSGYVQLLGSDNPLANVTVQVDSTPTFVDINGDGKLDIVSGDKLNNGLLAVWQNTTTNGVAVTVNVTPENDPPVVSGPVSAAATEDGALVSLAALANATDADTGAVLGATALPAVLPAGVTFDVPSQSFRLDPTNAAYQSLSLGEISTVTIAYTVSDGIAGAAASAVFTVSGSNDAPSVSGPVNGGNVAAGGAPVTLNLLSAASDIDHLDVLAVGQAGGNPVTASITSGTWAAPIAFTLVGSQLTVDPAQFAGLGAGKSVGISFAYQVTDGNPGGGVPASATLMVQGNYSGPTGVTYSPATASLTKALTGRGVTAKSALINLAQIGGSSADAYSFALGGAGASAFSIGTNAGVPQISVGNAALTGAAGGRLYALNVTATDTTAGVSAPPTALNVVVGFGSGAGVINLATLPSLDAAAPTFVYDLSGADQISATGLTGRVFIEGGLGADTMTGGAGATTYLYALTTDSRAGGMDIVTNFHAATDLIDLTGLGAVLASVGPLATDATSMAASSVGWQLSGGNTFLYVNPTAGSISLSSAAMKIELLGTPGIAAGNIAHL